MLLGYLLVSEQKTKQNKDRVQFKNDMFNHAFMSQNRELYTKVYPEDFGMSPVDEEDLEFIIPESEEEALSMFAELDALDDPDSEWRSTPLLG